MYAFAVRNNRRLPAGFFWIGFPVGLDRLLRVGFVSVDQHDFGSRGRMKWSFSFEATFRGRTIRAMFPVLVQYLEVEPDDVSTSASRDDLERTSVYACSTTLDQGNALKLLLYVFHLYNLSLS